MDYNEMLKNAREKLNGSCKVCKVCNGVACAGEVPGMGGKGSGQAFIENVRALERVKLNMRVIHNAADPDTSIELFGKKMDCAGEVPGMGGKGSGQAFIENVRALERVKLNMRVIHNAAYPDTSLELCGKKMDAPIFAAPITGTTLNMGGQLTEREYIEPVVEGCANAGIYHMVGDTAVDAFLIENLHVLKCHDGTAIVFIKPWDNENIIKKIRLPEEAGAFAVGVDIDACGLVTIYLHVKPFYQKDFENIKELFK